ncbi:hypothetical protein PCASD_10000 [Puccinia coronata f. sp. avenae]|uniref:Uncharacterized protein n=1 Tax=Puccinia coronata f. sp. avenae TaxID=200324 RepID=A0A2N5UUY0_9BASI|nr:hypothetical protein PCASD_10000 [Puccinia coronata f. sp. avenae]
MKSGLSNQANGAIEVLDVESNGNRSIPPIDPKPNGQDEAQNEFNGKTMKVLIGFKLFIAKKSTQKKKSWGPINSTTDFSITVTLGKTSFEVFQQMVASACNDQLNNTGPIILKGLSARPQGIFWNGSIAQAPSFAKKDLFEIKAPLQYNKWLEAACALGRTQVTLSINMTNPAKVAQRAEMEDLLAAQAMKDKAARALKRKATDDDSDVEESEDLDAKEWDTINVYMKQLFKAHLINAKYDCHTPVFIDPSNPRSYILLTVDACQEWAQALVDQKDGVTTTSPPCTLHYINLSKAPHERLGTGSIAPTSNSLVNDSNIQLLAALLAGRTQNEMSPTISGTGAKSTLSSPPNESNIEGYIDFLGIRNRDKEYTLEILLANGFHLHKVFKSSGLARSEVKELGLTLGVVTMLFDNVAKYDQHLSGP